MRAITSFKVLLRSNVRKLFGQVTVEPLLGSTEKGQAKLIPDFVTHAIHLNLQRL